MKKIVISGYYGFNNLGDEAVLAGITSLFKNREEEVKITVLSAEPEQTAEQYDLEAVSRTSLFQIPAVLAGADLFISGGGSLLQDVTGNFSVPYYLGLSWLAKLQGAKCVYYAQGAGPLEKKWSQKLTAFTLNRFDFLGVRDQGSKKLLQEIGVKKNIELTVDPVFALYNKLNTVRQQIKGKLEIGVSVRPWSVDYVEELAAALNKFAQSKNCRFLIFPMHQGSDESISHKLQKLLNTESKIINLPADPKKALKEFSQLDLFVGVRLHSLIFALLNQIPLLALSYDPKIEGLMGELDYLPLIKVEDLEAAQAAEKLEYLLGERYALRKKIKEYVRNKKRKAEDFAALVLEEVSS